MLSRLCSWLGVALALLILASCGGNAPGNQMGTLNIQLEGIASAPVRVLAGESVFDGTVSGSHKLELPAGTYRVDGMPVAGHEDPTNIAVEVLAGRETQATLQYRAVPTVDPTDPPDPTDPTNPVSPTNPPPPSAPVAGVSILSVKDMHGQDLPGIQEENAHKNVWLYAAQTEEVVCVSVRATAPGGAALAGALVTVQIADAFQDASHRISVVRGCASADGLRPQHLTAQNVGGLMDSVMTGADGTATFTLFATHGYTGGLGERDVAKLVVAVAGANGSSALTEFKMWFANITHLYFGETITTRRTGQVFERTNHWDSNDRKPGGAQNAMALSTRLYQKQPQADVDLSALGYIRYDILSETDRNGAAADVVHLEGCAASADGNSCLSYDGRAFLAPNAGIWLEQLPIAATVRATLVVEVRYGSETYRFDLKSYDVRKTWVSSYLSIDKRVDHHVLTWYGDNDDMDEDGVIEYTLDPANAVPMGSAFTATFTITATNTGQSPVYDVTITDGLPAELGVVEESLNPAGGTYDSINHAVTWNYQTVSDPRFDVLQPGESIAVSLQVYLRQKPGFCVDAEDLAASGSYMVGFLAGDSNYCYDDPYDVVNGGQLHDVTASWFVSKPADEGGTSAVIDFSGYLYEDQVIIWGVRPVFTLDKRLINTADLPFDVGMDGVFGITVRNEHRIIYDALEALYPDEFTGSRKNPYGRSIYLIDVFSDGLDFTSAGPLTVNGAPYASQFAGMGGSPFAPYLQDYYDKIVTWDIAPLMDYRSEAKARVVLDNDLPGVHVNVAGFTAGNANQLDFGDCGNVRLDPGLLDDFLRAASLAGFSGLLDCAVSTVLAPEDPFIELSAFPALNVVGLDLSRQTVVERGDEFVYVFGIQNGGSGTAPGTKLSVKLNNGNATLLSATQYVLDASLNLVATIPGTASGATASFAAYDHPVGYTAVFVLDARANKVGDNSATATATWSAKRNHTQFPLLPLQVVETVSIKPPTP